MTTHGPGRANSPSKTASSTTPTPPTRAASTRSGACTNGSTEPRATRNETRAEGDPLNFFVRHDEYDAA
jgi:hypothetical protein